MLVYLAVVVCGGATALRPVRRGCKKLALGAWHGAAYVGYMAAPGAWLDWENVRYQRWLEEHCPDDA